MSAGWRVEFLVEHFFREEHPMTVDQTLYPVTYQCELSPTWLHHAAVLAGIAPPAIERPFRYLELGCGRGYSALVHAASHREGEFHALDRDTAAIAQAQAWARACAVNNIRFHAQPFAAGRDLEPFDFIVLHGVYSWVAAEERTAIRALLRDLLRPGGLAYVSYNCLPGWAAEVPLRRLFSELSRDGGEISAAARELDGWRGLGFFKAHPRVERATASLPERPAGYLAAEYLSDSWEPLWSVDVIDEMEIAGLRHVGSASLVDHHDALLFDRATSNAIAALATPRLRMLARDFAVNRSFRRDLFMRGGRPEDRSSLANLSIGCPGDDIPQSVLVPRGRIGFQPAFVAALRRALAGGAVPLGDLLRALGGSEEAARNLMWLIAAGALAPFAKEHDAGERIRAILLQLGVSA
jgi:SAM-dependent methyltransferase